MLELLQQGIEGCPERGERVVDRPAIPVGSR
jgi:hypothetical protein